MTHEYHRMCGCEACCLTEEANERFDEALTELTDAWTQDARKLREAEEWTAGGHSGEHYTEVTLALSALHDHPLETLIGSDALARVLRIAKVEHDALYARMRGMAEAELQKGMAA